MTGRHVATTDEEYAALPEGTIVGDYLAPNKIGLEVLWQKLPDGLWWRYSTGQYYATLGGDTRPVLRHGWETGNPPPNKPEGEPMTRKSGEILDLIEVNDCARDQYNETHRALEKAVWEAREKHSTQSGEAWRVLLPWDRDVRAVVPAIKTSTGWVTDPGYFGDRDIDEGYRPESAVIPLERIAEAPNDKEAAQ